MTITAPQVQDVCSMAPPLVLSVMWMDVGNSSKGMCSLMMNMASQVQGASGMAEYIERFSAT